MGNKLLQSESLLVKMRKNNAESQESNGVMSSEGAGGPAPYLGLALVWGVGNDITLGEGGGSGRK